MIAEDPAQEVPPQQEPDKDFLLSKIEPPKIIDIIISKQNQYYTLWGGYTAVQFAAGSFALNLNPVPLKVGIAVLFGVWAFNIGHLGFVLQCVAHLNKLSVVLNAAVDGEEAIYKAGLRRAFESMQEGSYFWRFDRKEGPRSYGMNIFVHLFIDVCASIALLARVEHSEILADILSFLGLSSWPPSAIPY
jgi:hypothetical protein